MVTVANQQMDPEKAKLSSIDRGEQAPDFIGTPVKKEAPVETPTEQVATAPKQEYTRAEKYNSIIKKSGSYYNDVYLPKKQLEQSQKQ